MIDVSWLRHAQRAVCDPDLSRGNSLTLARSLEHREGAQTFGIYPTIPEEGRVRCLVSLRARGGHRRCCLRFARALAGAMRRRGGPDFGYRVCNDLSAPLVYSPWSHVNSRRVCVCQQSYAINLRADGKQTDHKFDLAVQTLAIATSLMRGRVNAGRPGKTVAKSSGISICMEPRQ